jgi:hypothetical protein
MSVGWDGGPKNILTHPPRNEDADLAIRSEGGGEQVAAMESSVSSPKTTPGRTSISYTKSSQSPLPGAPTVTVEV